jgi:hypothetical protein
MVPPDDGLLREPLPQAVPQPYGRTERSIDVITTSQNDDEIRLASYDSIQSHQDVIGQVAVDAGVEETEAVVTQALPQDINEVDADLSPDKTVSNTNNRTRADGLSCTCFADRTNARRSKVVWLSLYRR